jgi:CubicO group peptidase (beta-lactamase class C family)
MLGKRKGEMRRSLWALVIFVAAGCSSDRESEVDRLFADYRPDGTPGASVMVIKDGAPILTRSYGLASVEDDIPVTPSTNFRLASVTKQFTATSILMLADQGKLSLDDSITKFFPDFPEFANGIKIRHMLQHTSGIEDYEPLYGDPFPEQILDRGVVEIIAGTERTYFAPGSEYRYSNSAYAVLAVLVEDLSGLSFPAFLQQNIFTPLRMASTVAYRRGENSVPNRSYGYTVTDKLIEFSDQSAWSAVLGDGGIYSSVEDLFKWDQALYDGGLISPELRQAAWTPGLENYGFGWRIDQYKGHKRYHHSGSTSGYRNFMQQFPDERLTVIVLTNRADPDVAPLAEKTADLYLK